MGLHDRLHRQNGAENGQSVDALAALGGQQAEPTERKPDPYAELKTRIHHACIAKLGPQLYAAGRSEDGAGSGEDLAEKVLRAVTEQLALDRTPLTREERRQITREITDDILGYGPLEPLLRDNSITEVMVNNHDRVYIERRGKIEHTRAAFLDGAHLMRIIDKIVSQVGRRVDEAAPMVDARLPDGSRVNAIIPPLALVDLPPALDVRRPRLEADPVRQLDLQLGRVLDRHEALARRYEPRKQVEQRRLAGAGAAGDDDVQPGAHAGGEQVDDRAREGAQTDQVLGRQQLA